MVVHKFCILANTWPTCNKKPFTPLADHSVRSLSQGRVVSMYRSSVRIGNGVPLTCAQLVMNVQVALRTVGVYRSYLSHRGCNYSCTVGAGGLSHPNTGQMVK